MRWLSSEDMRRADKIAVGKLYLVNMVIPNRIYKELKITTNNYFNRGDLVRIK